LSDSSQKVYAIYCENEHVGNCGIKNIIAGSEGELWIYMGSPATRGKGVGTRATKLLVQEGMENMHFHKMYLHVADFNKAAYAMYQNIGFVEVPLVGDAGVWAGRGCNIIGMELTRS
jgi:RimJ/RimL family protein N-acetyltransferase